jgi:uncharacterized membrane protein
MNKLFNDPDRMPSDLFDDKYMDKYEKKLKRTFAVVMVFWIIYVLAALTFAGGVIYVAWHFVSKYW